jgi:ferredoxin--NADP+ reductase
MVYEVVRSERLAPGVHSLEVLAPLVARRARPGQFVMVMVEERGERIPLTISDWSNETIRLVFEVVGRTTSRLSLLREHDSLFSVAGPLGIPSEIRRYGRVAVVGGGVGSAACYPIARALRDAGNFVISILGARTRELLIMEESMRGVSDRVMITTDDGTCGRRGLVTDALRELLDEGGLDRVWAVGPARMMKAVSDLTRERGVETVVSLNAIMVDGTGMCGSCRVTVGGRTMFTCVDGPEFDGHGVDWEEFIARLSRYSAQERICAGSGGCRRDAGE